MTKYTLLKNKLTGERSVRINGTGERILESDSRYAELRKRALANAYRREHDDVLRSCGMVKTPYGWE